MDNHAVRQFQAFQNFLGVRDQGLELPIGLFGPSELHELDFIKLMLPENAPNVLAVRPGFTAETRCVCCEFHRQSFSVDDVIPINVRYRNLGGRDKVVVRVANLEEVVFKFWQLARTEEALGIGIEGWNDLFVSM